MYPFDEQDDMELFTGIWDMHHVESERDGILAQIREGKRLPYKVHGLGGYPRNLSSPFYMASYLKNLSKTIFRNQLTILRGGDDA